MAQEIGPSQLRIARDGGLALSTRFLFDSRSDLIRNYPQSLEGLLFAGANGEPFQRKDGKWILSANFEGLLADPSPDHDTFDLRGEEREVPIENFPDRELLKRDWGAYEDNESLLFRPKIQRPNEIGEVLNLDSYFGRFGRRVNEIDNPLFGTRSYPVEYQVGIWRLARQSVPGSIRASVGTVLSRLPTGFDYVDPKKKWYVRPLNTSKRGSMTRIEVQYKEISEFQALEAIQTLLRRATQA